MFSSLIDIDSTLSDTVKSVSGLANSTEYFWRVKAKNQAGWNQYSNNSRFSTIKSPDLTDYAYPETGIDTTFFNNTNISFLANISLSRFIGLYYFTIAPVAGGLPDGINSISSYFWSIRDSGIIFSGGILRIPLSFLGGIEDPTKLRWMKRSLSGDNWTDLGGIVENGYLVSTVPFNSFSEFAIGSQDVQPLASTNILLTAIPEGFYDEVNNRLNSRDPFKVYLRDINSPYALIDSAVSVIDSLTFGMFLEFHNAPTGLYFIVIKNRNTLETWSKSDGIVFTKYTSMAYNFTTSQNNAYGSNQILKGTKWCLYSGDINQDGTIDLNDMIPILSDYDNLNYHLDNDINHDGTVDLNDAVFVLSGYDNLISIIIPSKFYQLNNKKTVNSLGSKTLNDLRLRLNIEKQRTTPK